MKFGSLKLNTILAIIPIAFILAFITALGIDMMSNEDKSSAFVKPLASFLMIAYFAVPTIGIPYFFYWLFSIVWGGLFEKKTRHQKIIFIVYFFIAIAYSGYIAWWYLSSQEFIYL